MQAFLWPGVWPVTVESAKAPYERHRSEAAGSGGSQGHDAASGGIEVLGRDAWDELDWTVQDLQADFLPDVQSSLPPVFDEVVQVCVQAFVETPVDVIRCV